MRRSSVSLLALAFAVAALGFSSGPEAEKPTGRLVFLAYGSASGDVLWTMGADGTGARRVTRSRVIAEVEPEWSPDGRRIAYSRSEWCPTEPFSVCNRIWTVNADGSDARRLIPRRVPGPLANRAVSFHAPTWSPDGRRIVYQRWDDEGGDCCEVFVMNADGSGQRKLTRRPGFDGGPAWSPGGGLIAFVSGGEDPVIYVMPADGSGRAQRVMRSPKLAEYELDWGPEPG